MDPDTEDEKNRLIEEEAEDKEEIDDVFKQFYGEQQYFRFLFHSFSNCAFFINIRECN